MSQTGSDTNAVRREVAHVLRRMRLMRKKALSLPHLLDELAALRKESSDALKYVNFAVTRPNKPDQPARLTFHVNKERLTRTPRVLLGLPS